MNTTVLVLIRHGDCEPYNDGQAMKPGPGLTRQGKKQAKCTAKYLKEYDYDVIISSEMTRAIETATIIDVFHKKNVTTYPDITEFHESVFEKGSKDEEHKTKAVKAVKAFQELLQEHGGKQIVLITHGNVMRGLVGHLLGFGIEESPDFNFLHAAITSMTLEGEKVTGMYHFNSASHYRKISFSDRFDKGSVH